MEKLSNKSHFKIWNQIIFITCDWSALNLNCMDPWIHSSRHHTSCVDIKNYNSSRCHWWSALWEKVAEGVKSTCQQGINWYCIVIVGKRWTYRGEYAVFFQSVLLVLRPASLCERLCEEAAAELSARHEDGLMNARWKNSTPTPPRETLRS